MADETDPPGNCAFCDETGETRGLMFWPVDRSTAVCNFCVEMLHEQLVTIKMVEAEQIAAEREGRRLN